MFSLMCLDIIIELAPFIQTWLIFVVFVWYLFEPILIILGLSERLEVQEMYENLQEERLDLLQGDLVSCIEGEEGLGGQS